ncbi:unnamed protein product [Brassica napus]|uniref:GAGA-binding transcriptional activator n=1 Tax=Brassica napus TaxID=3708 RepID=A0A816ULI8_BRANA|nr:unnamed protein product [Brassica napus]
MDLPRDVETTNHSLEIPITMDALQKKLFAAQGSQLRLYEQYMSSVSRLKKKDQVIDLVRSEASINAQALKKLDEEDQILRGEYDDLVNQCNDLKRECFIYQLDLEASKRSGNKSEQRAREADSRARVLEQELKHVYSIIKKHESLVDSVLATIIFAMDDDGFRNWGYYEPAAATSFKGNLGLQLMPTIDRNTKPFLPGRDPNLMIGQTGSYHHHQHHPEPHMSYNWINQHKDKFFNMLPVTTTPNYGNVLPQTSSSPSMHMNLHHHHHQTEEHPVKCEPDIVESKKRKPNSKAGGAPTKAKKPRKPKEENGDSNNANVSRVKPAKKSFDLVINGVNMDISGLPVPVCTCTGAPQQCYRWGCGGWQSACCTTNISMHPLPMSTKRRGARISGRKMSQGAFKKVLEKLASDGFNFGSPINLKSHWARHGTNKFVTIR